MYDNIMLVNIAGRYITYLFMYNNILINLNFLQLIYDRYLSQYELFYQN